MIKWIKPRSSGRATKTTYIAIAVSKSGSVASGDIDARSICIRFTKDACKDLRLVAGDRLRLGFDEDNGQVVFQRTNESDGTYRLSSTKNVHSLTVQAKTDLPWHASLPVSKQQTHIKGDYIALDARDILFPMQKAA
jgi:hypothetical protein